jgi:hypothetical protein
MFVPHSQPERVRALHRSAHSRDRNVVVAMHHPLGCNDICNNEQTSTEIPLRASRRGRPDSWR